MVNVYITILLVSTYCVNCKCLDVRKKNNSIDYEKRKQDGVWMTGKRAYSKAYYIQHNKRMKTQARIAYKKTCYRKCIVQTGTCIKSKINKSKMQDMVQ